MKNPKVGALLVILVLLLVFVGPTIWKNTIGKTEQDQQQTTVKEKEEACAGGPAKIDHGSLAEWSNEESYPKKGETVTFEGYVDMPNLTFINGGTYMVNLRQDSTLEGSKVTMQITEGDCENTMLPIPDDYDSSDLVIYDNAGKEVVQGEKVRVTGKVTDDGPLYMFWVKRIEKR